MPRLGLFIWFAEKSIKTTHNKIVTLQIINENNNSLCTFYASFGWNRLLWRNLYHFAESSNSFFMSCASQRQRLFEFYGRNSSVGKISLTNIAERHCIFFLWFRSIPIVCFCCRSDLYHSELNWANGIFGSTQNLLNAKQNKTSNDEIYRLNAMVGIRHKLPLTNNPNDHVST